MCEIQCEISLFTIHETVLTQPDSCWCCTDRACLASRRLCPAVLCALCISVSVARNETQRIQYEKREF